MNTDGQEGGEDDKHVHKSVNVFEDMEASEGSTQVFVSSIGTSFAVARAKVAIGALQLSGQLLDPTIQQISQDHRARVLNQRPVGSTPQRSENVGESREGEFVYSYGRGQLI